MQTLPKSAKQKERYSCVTVVGNPLRAPQTKLKKKSQSHNSTWRLNCFFVTLSQGSSATAEEVPEAVWGPSEMGPKISGADRLTGFNNPME